MTQSDLKQKNFVFVAGLARSGTSAFAELLCAHSEMIVGNERFYNWAEYEHIAKLTPAAFEKDVFLFPTPDETHNHVWNDGSPYQLHLLSKYDGAKVLGDKVPHYFYHTEYLLTEFPNAKLIFLTRNVFDCAASWQKRRDDAIDDIWMADHAKAVAFWNQAHRSMLEQVAAWPGRIGVVSYERLYAYSPGCLNAILNWLDVTPGDQAAFTWYRKATRDWMARWAAPRHLTPEQRAHVAEQAEPDLRRVLIDQAEIA